MQILADINREDGTTVVVTLHQVDYAMRYCQRAVALKAGRIHYDGAAAELHPHFLNDLYGAELSAESAAEEAPRRPRKAQVPLALAKA
jgi:phosphonate transport system ATP-binding protein